MSAKNLFLITKLWRNLLALFRMFRAWGKGDYTDVSWKSVLLSIGALTYLVFPFDLISDIMPGLGQLDDAAIIGLVLTALEADIQRFLAWEERVKKSAAP